MSWRTALNRAWQWFDYRVMLPGLARLPLPVGALLAQWRGLFNGWLDLDWRSLSLQQRFVYDATYAAQQQLCPQATPQQWRRQTLQRFVVNSREEWEASLFLRYPVERFKAASTVYGLQEWLSAQRAGQPMVLLTPHFDSFCMGIVLLGLHGLKVHAVSSAVVEDPRVHPAVRRFYWQKYRGMERYMNGGLIRHQEQDNRHFYRALQQGEAVVILADLPTPNQQSLVVPFLGQLRCMASGPLRVAQKTHSLVGAFVCLHERTGQYRLMCAPLRSLDTESPARSFVPLYAFLDAYLHRYPARWWAADLLRAYHNAT